MASKNVELKFTALDRASAIISKITDRIDTLKNKMNQSAAINPTKNAEQALKRMNKFAEGAQSIGQSLTLGLSAPLVGFGKNIVSSGADYEYALRDLQGRIDNLQPGQIEKLGEIARKLGVDMGVGATETTKAFTALAKAGAGFDELAQGAGETAINLSAAEEISGEAASNLLSNMMKVFKITDFKKIKSVGDMLGKASGISSISIVDLDYAMRHASGAASSYGMKLEQVAAGIASLGNLGIKGEMGGTTLQWLVNSIGGDPTRQAKLVAAGARKEDFFNADGTMKGFDKIFEVLHKLNLSGEQFTDIFGKEHSGKIRLAADAYQTFASDLEKVVNQSEGYLSVLAKLKLDTFWGAWKQMKAAFADIGAAMATDGTLQTLTDFVEILRDVLVWFNKLPSPIKKTVFVIGTIGIALGPVIWLLGSLAGAFTNLLPILKTIGITSFASFGIWGLAILGVIALIGLMAWKWDDFWYGTEILTRDAKAWVSDFFDFTDMSLDKLIAKMQKLIELPSRAYNYSFGGGFLRDAWAGLTKPDAFETEVPQDQRNPLANPIPNSNPEDFFRSLKNPTVTVDFLNTPFGTTIREAENFGKPSVNLNIGQTSRFAPARP